MLQNAEVWESYLLKSQSYGLAKSGNFRDVCVLGGTNLPPSIQTPVKFLDIIEPYFRYFVRCYFQAWPFH